MKVLIADDEAVARRGLRTLLAREADVVIVGEAAGGDEARALIQTTKPDVVLLDIQMPHTSGIDVVASIDPAELPLVIFITAHDEHAIRAFELHALDYLVKPFRVERLREALGRVRRLLSHERRHEERSRIGAWVEGQAAFLSRIRIESAERIRFVAVRDVLWIEAQDYCVLLHLAEERVLQRGTLRQFLRTIDPRIIARVHRSAAVNLRHIRELVVLANGGVAARLSTGVEVPVAKAFRADLEAKLRALP